MTQAQQKGKTGYFATIGQGPGSSRISFTFTPPPEQWKEDPYGLFEDFPLDISQSSASASECTILKLLDNPLVETQPYVGEICINPQVFVSPPALIVDVETPPVLVRKARQKRTHPDSELRKYNTRKKTRPAPQKPAEEPKQPPTIDPDDPIHYLEKPSEYGFESEEEKSKKEEDESAENDKCNLERFSLGKKHFNIPNRGTGPTSRHKVMETRIAYIKRKFPGKSLDPFDVLDKVWKPENTDNKAHQCDVCDCTSKAVMFTCLCAKIKMCAEHALYNYVGSWIQSQCGGCKGVKDKLMSPIDPESLEKEPIWKMSVSREAAKIILAAIHARLTREERRATESQFRMMRLFLDYN